MSLAVTDSAIDKTLRTGWILLAVSLPLGVTLEALHGFKVQAYVSSEMRREMWRLAHAHGTLLGMLGMVTGIFTIGQLSQIPSLVMVGGFVTITHRAGWTDRELVASIEGVTLGHE